MAAVVLVYLPIVLAAAAAWLTRKMNVGMVVIAHVVGIVLSLLFWLV
ncbi:MAG: hypothetical protein QM708_09530 [Propioniciclava sp.]